MTTDPQFANLVGLKFQDAHDEIQKTTKYFVIKEHINDSVFMPFD